ncbi:hypothetical protein AYO38_10900 [bacterium SCGC AG-212-C10]|nr:hypothetical protein AYO38_10900 [bacterium SCGC AG-212-C10]
MAGESAPGEPSRAEILALRPELADSVAGAPTDNTGEYEPLAQENGREPEPTGAARARSAADLQEPSPADVRRVEAAVGAVFRRLNARRGDAGEDIYVWSDGTVTGPPTGDESGSGQRLITVVAMDAERPTHESLTETIRAGIAVQPATAQ